MKDTLKILWVVMYCILFIGSVYIRDNPTENAEMILTQISKGMNYLVEKINE